MYNIRHRPIDTGLTDRFIKVLTSSFLSQTQQ